VPPCCRQRSLANPGVGGTVIVAQKSEGARDCSDGALLPQSPPTTKAGNRGDGTIAGSDDAPFTAHDAAGDRQPARLGFGGR
jgi:hypothetical protein